MIRRIAPMKINKIPKGKEHLLSQLCESGDYYANIKKDGYWYEFEKSDEGSFLFSSNESAVTHELVEKSANVPHLIETLSGLPDDTIIIGEIYYPNGTSKDVTPIMGSLAEKAIERQNGEFGLLHYYLHDIIYYNGVDLRSYGSWVRYHVLKAIYNKFELFKNECIELADCIEDNIEEAINVALASGEEGMVLKKKNCIYHTGMRSPVWETIKVKKTDGCDAIIIGFCDPTKEYTGKELPTWDFWIRNADNTRVQGKYFQEEGYSPVTKAYYYNWKTSMKVGAYDDNGNLVEIGTISSGLTEELEADFAIHPEAYLNRVVELHGMMKDNKEKSLRHFFFDRFRDDKNPKDCLVSEIFS